MNKPAPVPQLNDLASLPRPAWLWDVDRNRIVWANRYAIEYFDGQSLFDVVDRQFDQNEPAVEQLSKIRHQSKSDERCEVNLALMADSPLHVTASIHALADGRQGVLVVATAGATTHALPEATLQQAFAVLPMAIAFLMPEGELVNLNDAALLTFPLGTQHTLATLFVDQQRATNLLRQLQERKLTSSIERVIGRIGPRDMRVTCRKLDNSDLLAVATFEDVTERRQIERQLIDKSDISQATPLPLEQSKFDAFDTLAKSMKDAISTTQGPPVESKKTHQDNALAIKPESLDQLQPAPAIPAAIRKAMERSGESVVIVRHGKIAYATPKAAADYGLTNGPPSPFGDNSNLKRLMDIRAPLSSTEIIDAEGDLVGVDVSLKTVPWQDGPAQQYIIRKISDSGGRAKSTSAPTTFMPLPTEGYSNTTSVLEQNQVDCTPLPPSEANSAVAQITMSRRPPAKETEYPIAPDDELKAILDIASDGIITLDAEGRILSYSAGAEAIFGYALPEIKGKHLSTILSPASLNTWNTYFAALQGPGLARVFNDGREVEAVVKQGGTVPLFLALGLLGSAKSEARFCAVVRDITSWKRTEKELREARDLAEAANRQKSYFLAHISHELRTPLNAIMGFSEVMQQEKFGSLANDKYRGYADDIHASGQHLLSLIDDLLDLSRVESGKMDLSFVAVNLSETTEHAVRMLQAEAAQRRVLLRMSFGKNLPLVVADLRSMRQVMMNILSNSIKFTEPGGQVILSAQVQADGAMVWRVRDTGIGMSSDQVRTALEPFKRIATEGRETQGTGLGLPLAKALAEANRAEFAISSVQGKGTLVEVIFPTNRVLAE